MSTVSELAIQAKTDPAQYAALWTAVERLVVLWASRYHTDQGTRLFDMDDLIQSGYLAMCDAVQNYDPERGAFNTLFGYHVKTRFAEASGTRGSKRRPEHYAVSLDVPLSEDNGTLLLDTLIDPGAEFEDDIIEREAIRQDVAAIQPVIDALPENQRKALILTACDKLPHKRAAEIIGVETVDIRKLRELAKNKIRSSMPGRKIWKEYNHYRRIGISEFRRTHTSEQEQYLLWLEEIENRTRRIE